MILGVVGQSNPSGAPAASSHVELPSPHPASGVLVRPIPQQPSPVRVRLCVSSAAVVLSDCCVCFAGSQSHIALFKV